MAKRTKKATQVKTSATKVEEEFHYRKIVPLAAYIDRIGGEELNFRKFIVREYHGHYYAEKAIIRISEEGDVSAPKQHAPTKEEAAAIKGAMAAAKFPKSIGATVDLFKELERHVRGTLYPFWDRKDDLITFVQERGEKDGHKFYVPWTFWSDGHWRMMEPNAGLPFWKPRKPTQNSTRIMIHEGAKTAKFVHDLITDPEKKKELADHPWGEELATYEHWGLVGGALAPHRADYSEITRQAPSAVVYVCDNDDIGKAAISAVSRCYGKQIKTILFDNRWPHAWDMADPVPERFYSTTEKGGKKVRRYVGPMFNSLLTMATFATEVIPNPQDKGRPLTKLRLEFAREWVHSVSPEVYIHIDWPDVTYTEKEFNHRVRPFSDVEETARLIRMHAENMGAMIRYTPCEASGILANDATKGERYINTHMPSTIEAEQGDPTPYVDFMNRLCPVEVDRIELTRWVHTLIARPDIKMAYGVLLISEEQGVGKGTLGEKILAPLVGPRNVSFPSEQDVVESQYNYWAAHKRLAVVHEIYAGQSTRAYNKLKSIITDRVLTVNRKYQATYEIENWVHVFACSNSIRALKLSMNDRRWYVPKITEKKQNARYWQELNHWLTEEGGLSIVKWYAAEWLKKNTPVQVGDIAPWSQTKRDMADEALSPGQTLVKSFLEKVQEEREEEETIVVLDVDLIRMIRNQLYEGKHNDRLEKPNTVRKVAKSYGWYVGEKCAQIKAWGTRCTNARVISNNADVAAMEPVEIAKKYKPVDPTKLAQKWEML